MCAAHRVMPLSAGIMLCAPAESYPIIKAYLVKGVAHVVASDGSVDRARADVEHVNALLVNLHPQGVKEALTVVEGCTWLCMSVSKIAATR